MASLRPRLSAIRPGSANTSCASRDTSRSLRAAGNETATAPLPAGERSIRTSGRTGASASRSHGHRAPGLLLDRRQRPGIAFEKADVRAVAADGDVDDQRAAAGGRGERSLDQRRLAVAARRDEEDLLAGEQIAGQAVELVFAIDERGLGHDLAIDEGVCRHYAICRNSYGDYRNGGTGAIAPDGSAAAPRWRCSTTPRCPAAARRAGPAIPCRQGSATRSPRPGHPGATTADVRRLASQAMPSAGTATNVAVQRPRRRAPGRLLRAGVTPAGSTNVTDQPGLARDHRHRQLAAVGQRLDLERRRSMPAQARVKDPSARNTNGKL